MWANPGTIASAWKKVAGHKAELVNQLLNLRVSLHFLQDEATALTQKITDLTGRRNLLQDLLTKTADSRRQLDDRIRGLDARYSGRFQPPQPTPF